MVVSHNLIMTMKNKCNHYRDFRGSLNYDYNNWLSYHDDKLLEIYPCNENYETRIFNTSNVGYEGKSLNHLHRFLSEGCCLLYPWLNNLETHYIGFQHYRRRYNTNMNVMAQKLLAQNYIQYFHCHYPQNELQIHIKKYGLHWFNFRTKYINIENHCFFWSMDKCGIMDDMIEYLEKSFPQYLEGEKSFHNMYWGCIFVTNWKTYTHLAQFIYLYIKFINDKYKLEWDEHKWYDHVYEKFMKYNQEHHPKYPDHQECRRVENDGSVWCELPFWGNKGWTYGGFEGYTGEFHEKINLWRVYAYNIEFLTSVFIHNHPHYIDQNNRLYFINEDGSTHIIENQENGSFG